MYLIIRFFSKKWLSSSILLEILDLIFPHVLKCAFASAENCSFHQRIACNFDSIEHVFSRLSIINIYYNYLIQVNYQIHKHLRRYSKKWHKFFGGNNNQGNNLLEKEIEKELLSDNSHENITGRDVEKTEGMENVEKGCVEYHNACTKDNMIDSISSKFKQTIFV